MSDLSYYLEMKAKVETERQRMNYAHAALELALIKARLAELKSQSQPLHDLIEKPLAERDRLYAAAFYAVVGRLP